MSTKNFTIKRRAGKLQQHIDALSRTHICLNLDIDRLREFTKKEDLTFLPKPVEKHGIVTVKIGDRFRAYVPKSLRRTLLQSSQKIITVALERTKPSTLSQTVIGSQA